MTVWIGLCGIVGALMRFYLGKIIADKSKTAFPFGTFVINLTGSLILGALYALYQRGSVSGEVWLLAGVGFCGAYTTFSTFGLEAVQLVERGMRKAALFYVLLSAILGVCFAWIGFLLCV
ncbi:fluoride efflux transporter CrcB [Brevibacillus fluminis]|uniref:fluoride efflux transporter CrcB n=1 Tax=Brevibacillus fluminis TaxID=511487 RepID=UPI003F8A26D5